MDLMFRKLQRKYENVKVRISQNGNDEEDPELEIKSKKSYREYKYLESIIFIEGTAITDIEHRTQQGKQTVNSQLDEKRIEVVEMD